MRLKAWTWAHSGNPVLCALRSLTQLLLDKGVLCADPALLV